MKKQETVILAIAAVLSGALLGGCQATDINSSGNTQPAAPAGASSSGEQIQQEDESSMDWNAIPDSFVLAPGSEQALPYANGITYQTSAPDVVTVSPDGKLTISEHAAIGSKADVIVDYQGKSKTAQITVKTSLEETIKMVNNVPTVTNSDDLAVVVNKERSLPDGYIPAGLTEPQVPFPFSGKAEKKLLREPAARALEELFAAAQKDGIQLYGVSGYRSYRTQKSLYEGYVQTQGAEHASRYSAVPGKSEHQTGLAMDVSGADAKTRLEEPFADTAEGKWLAANCAEYGFIIRYPKGREEITGYAYEPWHLRYVGKVMAKEIMEKGISLEEYFQDAVAVQTKQ
ncbi:M15 family metallopeptidase [Brevibacillus ruminantium]|uniref:M15 family metallopeptidase n=1 Tax=Brevibacillus ruminantium TaxID=2950604 RepID=A0ABY4WNI4_9BACL|nr:M15 family metallopeptidase [Brevibacillus ruminantium]USG67703.1 M15 family metallopeptidase [Brevibacillus ruminantium]